MPTRPLTPEQLGRLQQEQAEANEAAEKAAAERRAHELKMLKVTTATNGRHDMLLKCCTSVCKALVSPFAVVAILILVLANKKPPAPLEQVLRF